MPLPDIAPHSWTWGVDCKASKRGTCFPINDGRRDFLVLGSQDHARGLHCKCETEWKCEHSCCISTYSMAL
eukprot:353025-Prorocentrum_lima.AAC.1